MTAFATLTDEQLLAQVRRTADTCVAVVAMPVKERRAIRGPGKVDAEQAGALSAMMTVLAWDECQRRGIA